MSPEDALLPQKQNSSGDDEAVLLHSCGVVRFLQLLGSLSGDWLILTVQTPTPWLGNTRLTKPVPALEPLHSTKYVTWRAHSACYVLTRRCFVNIHTRVTGSHSVLDHTFTVVSCAKHVTSHTRYSYVLKRSSIALCQSVYSICCKPCTMSEFFLKPTGWT